MWAPYTPQAFFSDMLRDVLALLDEARRERDEARENLALAIGDAHREVARVTRLGDGLARWVVCSESNRTGACDALAAWRDRDKEEK